MIGEIYAIRMADSRYVKIGYSASPRARMAALQVGCPMDLILVATAAATRDIERRLQAIFEENSDSHRGEWYDTPFRDVHIREFFAAIDLYSSAETREDKALVAAIFEESLAA